MTYRSAASIAIAAAAGKANYVLVQAKADLPTPSAGVITLAADTTYEIRGTVALTTDRIAWANGAAIIGMNPVRDKITYTGTGTMFTGTDVDAVIANLSLDAGLSTGNYFSFTNNGRDKHIVIRALYADNCATIGTITGYVSVICKDNEFQHFDDGITFSAPEHLLFEGNAIFHGNRAAGTLMTVTGASVQGAHVADNHFHPRGTGANKETGLSLDSATTTDSAVLAGNTFVPAEEGIAIDAGGETFSSIKWEFAGNAGIQNSHTSCQVVLRANATATTIATVNTPVLAAGTYAVSDQSRMTGTTAGRMTYNGNEPVEVTVIATMSGTSASNNVIIGMYIAKNGTKINNLHAGRKMGTGSDKGSMTVHGVVSLVQNDYIECFLENETSATNITAVDLQLTAHS